MLQDRGALLKEDGDIVREYKAMHENNFPSSWLWKVRRKEEGRRKADKETREEVSRSGKKEEKKGKDQTVVVKRRCVNLVSGDAFEEFSHVEDSDSCGNSWGDLLGDSCGLSECVPEVLSGVLDVTDVLYCPSSLVVMGEALLSDSEWKIVELQSFFFSPESVKRSVWRIKKTKNYDGTPVKAPLASRRKIMPPTPQQSLQPLIEAMQLHTEVEDQESGSRERFAQTFRA